VGWPQDARWWDALPAAPPPERLLIIWARKKVSRFALFVSLSLPLACCLPRISISSFSGG